MQPWYTDDAVERGKFAALHEPIKYLIVRGNLPGYSTDPTNSILVVSLRIVPSTEEYFQGMGVHMVTGSLYLGGFICDPVTENTWIDYKVKGWTASGKLLDGVDRQHP